MSSNYYRSPFHPKPNPPHSDTNPIVNPSNQYDQSPIYKPKTNKTSQFKQQQFMPSSSMNINYLQGVPKFPTNRFSPAQFNKKQENCKNNDITDPNSMLIMDVNQGPVFLNQTQKILGRLSKLSSMGRIAQKNFDDSGDFDQVKNSDTYENQASFQKGKLATQKKYPNTTGKQFDSKWRGYKPKQASVSSSMLFNIGQQSNDMQEFLVYPATSRNSQRSDFKKTGFLDFLSDYKEEKKPKQLGEFQLSLNKGCNSSVKVIDNQNKNFLSPSDNVYHKLFHEYSAPDMGHEPKNHNFEPVKTPMNHNFEPVKTPMIRKMDLYVKPGGSQFDSPTHSNDNFQLQYNKYSSPQQQGSSRTFFNKYSSDKPENRFNPSQNFAFELNPIQNSFGINAYSPSAAFTKKDKQVEQDSLKAENKTPNKQKFMSPQFFKNKQAKLLSEAKTLETITSPSSPKIMQFNDSTDSPTQFRSTFSDDGSNDSIDFMNQDFSSEGHKNWELDNFELGDKLGKGAFADVYIAREKKLGFMCVLKKISKKRIKELKREEHVIRQLKIQMYLNHKHLTAMYGYFHDKDYIYLILEYLPDGNLSQIKKRKKTSEKQTAEIVKQVCEGLDFMHKNSIIHRDIKPQNIFCNEGYIKLGDFGCSVCTDGMRKSIVSCLEYSSPEQLNGGQYNEKIDIWGIGILAYELLTGRSPYEKEIMKMGSEQVDFRALKFPEELKLSETAKDFIKSLLNVDPDDRLDVNEALKHKFIALNFEGSLKNV